MTSSEQVIKSMLFLLDNTESDGEPISDALQSLSRTHAEILRDLCKKYRVQSGDQLPFEDLSESIKHQAKVDCFTDTFWFDKFNDMHPDEVTEILEKENYETKKS